MRRKTRSGSRLLLIPPDSRHHHCVLTQRAALSPPLIGKQALCHSAQPPPVPASQNLSPRALLAGRGSAEDTVFSCMPRGVQAGGDNGGVTNAGKKSFVSWQSVCNLCQWGSVGLG